ncbi:MAG TPA: methylmalonyl Co-A mutase-associated GTPase MeaB [Casimicrobiaceae bacterium]|nr:methylmalonyl Co-A mutase-associated GTPase MeaB [Casimicrobiaceae bacterium]
MARVAFVASSDLVAPALAGDVRAIARLLTRAENPTAESRPAFDAVYARAGRAHVVGITGVPGSGKSTLVARIAAAIRAGGRKVAIVAIDPSSPFSGGAILGDRIRMGDLGGDPGVFVRSMATRGALGGLAHGTLEAVDVLDAAGYDIVMIETVGVGQDEVDVARAAHTTVVVSAPGLGDDIQAIKAGILEIADIHVVSKCDRADAERTIADLKTMLMLGIDGVRGTWRPPVVATSAARDEGTADLVAAIDRHRAALEASDEITARRALINERRLVRAGEEILRERFVRERDGRLAALLGDLERRTLSPRAAATRLIAELSSGDPP